MRSRRLFREIEIPRDGALPVRADLRTAAPNERRALVIICHGFLGYKRWGFFPYLSERLAARGFHVLTMSFSRCGVDEATGRIVDPDLFAGNTVSAEIEDIRSVVRFARSGGLGLPVPDNGPWGFLGHSRGGAVALLVAPEIAGLRSLVTWSTPGRLDRYTARRKAVWKRDGALIFDDPRADVPLRLAYGYYEDIDRHRAAFDCVAAANRLTAAHLMVHGDRDGAVTLAETRALCAASRPGEWRLEVIHGAGHTMNVRHPMVRTPAALERAVSLSETWLQRTLYGERMNVR